MRRIRDLAVALLLTICAVTPAAADRLPQPIGQVLLTVDGRISNANVGNSAGFDWEMLVTLGMHTLETSNPWVKGMNTFEGVLLADVLRAVGVTDGTLEARALDGFTVDVPVRDAFDFPVLLAMKWNGEVMRVRNKGPIWIVYPVDQYAELKKEQFSSRSIWQLQQLTVR